MRRAILRSIGVAACTLAIGGVLDVVYLVSMCPAHRAWERVTEGRSALVLDRGYALARAGDAIYVCNVADMIGPVTLHQDLTCVCAPATLGADGVGARVNGRCVVDKLTPARTDATGGCRYARCAQHVDR